MNYLKERDGDLFSNADLKRLIVPLLIEQLLAIAVGTSAPNEAVRQASCCGKSPAWACSSGQSNSPW